MKKEGGVGGGQVERPWLPKLGFCRSSTLGWRETEKLGEAEENGGRLCSGKRGRSKTARNGGHRITPNVGRAPRLIFGSHLSYLDCITSTAFLSILLVFVL